GNTSAGVSIAGTSAMGNVVAGNFIGTDPSERNLGNGVGIVIDGGASNNTIGGTVAGAVNSIAHNTRSGVSIAGTSAMGNVVAGNSIKTDAAGAAIDEPTSILIVDSAHNTIAGNTIKGAGVAIDISGFYLPGIPLGNLIQGNLIQAADTGVYLNNASGN